MGKKRLEALFEQNRELDAQIARTNTEISLYKVLLAAKERQLSALESADRQT